MKVKTPQNTKDAVSTFREYLTEKGLSIDIETFDCETLNDKLKDYYPELKNAKGETYKRRTLLAIRTGLVPFFVLEENGHVGVEFKPSTDTFISMLKAISRQGKCRYLKLTSIGFTSRWVWILTPKRFDAERMVRAWYVLLS